MRALCMANFTLTSTDYGWHGVFRAMASPCELLLQPCSQTLAQHLVSLAYHEAQRIEAKYSRYRTDSVLSQLNLHAGAAQKIDSETAALLAFAAHCYRLSDGMFDISSGVLRRVWQFDGSDNLPHPDAVAALLPLIGFDKVQFDEQHLWLPPGMELDFGGIAKEYAVDKVAQLLQQATAVQAPELRIVVNFGGDMAAVREQPEHSPWRIGIEHPGLVDNAAMLVSLRAGALATSGDARRFLCKDGVRYSHILNPKTGWPVEAAPRSITIAAPNCTLAGLLATTALLQGRHAQAFLNAQQIRYWLIP